MTAVSPTAKIILYIVLVIAVFISDSFKADLILLCIVIAIASKAPFSVLKRGIIPISLFLTFTFISNMLFQEGQTLYDIFGLTVTREGLRRGGLLTLRLVILILGAKVLTATTKAEELVSGMKGLLGPVGKVAYVRELIYTMSLTLRLLPIVYNEAMDLYRDVKNSDGSGLTGKIKLAAALLTPLFERSLEKAKEISAMEEEIGN